MGCGAGKEYAVQEQQQADSKIQEAPAPPKQPEPVAQPAPVTSTPVAAEQKIQKEEPPIQQTSIDAEEERKSVDKGNGTPATTAATGAVREADVDDANKKWRRERNQVIGKGSVGGERKLSVSENREPPPPKSPEVIDFLHAVLDDHPLFVNLSSEQREAVFDAMYPQTVLQGETLYTQGEHATLFFVVQQGQFEVSLGDEKCTIAEGTVFGDTALMASGSRRNETVSSVADGVLFTLNRHDFHEAVTKNFAKLTIQMEEFLKKVPLLSDLAGEQRAAIVAAMTPAYFESGEKIITQGDIGDALYIIEEGQVVVKVNKQVKTGVLKDDAELEVEAGADTSTHFSVEVGRHGPGDYIGEGALLTQEPRSADVIALSNVKCQILRAEDFADLLGNLHEVMDYNFGRRVLRRVEVFKTLNDDALDQVYDSLQVVRYEEGDYIIRQGDPGDNFYIIKEGQVRCTRTEDDGHEKEIVDMFASDYFGEGALLTDDVRNSNIVAITVTTCLALSKEDFKVILAPITNAMDEGFQLRTLGDHDPATVAHMKFGDLQKLRTIGTGGFGTVNLVRHKITGATYALKRLRKAAVVEKRQEAAVQREHSVLASINHPFIANLIRTFQDKDSVYMLMEIALGGELFTLLTNSPVARADGSLDLVLCRFYTAIIVSALEYMHSQGVIHRDLKPENLLLTRQGYMKLIDFGFAKVVHDERTLTLCGTPMFIAPEVYRRVGHGKGADWWSLGVLLYDIASGQSWFGTSSGDPYDCFRLIMAYEEAYPNVEFPANVDPVLQDLLLRLVHPNPLKRLGSGASRWSRLGTNRIKKHPWFANAKFDWKALEAQTMPAPFVPQVDNIMDTSNFDEEFEDIHGAEDELTGYDEADHLWAKDF